MTGFVAIDTETTGLGSKDPAGGREDGIVQVGVAWRDESKSLQFWERTCNPGRRFLAGGRANRALEISGLSLQSVEKSEPSQKVAASLRAVLAKIGRHSPDFQLLAFNVEFDREFLQVAPWKIGGPWGPCVMARSAQRFQAPNGRIPLWKAASLAGVTPPGKLHSAGADASTALLVHEFLERSAQA